MPQTAIATDVHQALDVHLNTLPLIPLSATTFESTGAIAEFFVDANGAVTRLVLGQTEGEAVYTPRK